MLVKDIVRSEYYGSIITDLDGLLASIPKIESLFRNSKEYKSYIAGIREGLQIKNCAYFVDKDFSEVDLELHHIFPTLYDIVLLLGSIKLSRLEYGEFFTVYDVVNDVIKFHMEDLPTVMMLSSTLHQLHHTGQYQLPKESKSIHIGEYKKIFERYYELLSEKDFDTICYFLKDTEVEELKNIWQEKVENCRH